ncbi:MAG TPA: bifunctional phosphoribosyl-AMP cyclohydrolase/phosphoribosyl-ATP diphosphatase HisIE [Gemmatimonadales bacterium]|nr:bifunctional phosphoribosyl-AMP cyclohydrolase/phosphoribosyl-ATP diphosphatase HisIE [Gemmatimonadales bacterium]
MTEASLAGTRLLERESDLDTLNFAKGGGLVTVVAQDAESGAVLMVAHGDRESLARSLESGEMHYRSRSRGLWHKGATSGNVQRVVSLASDCDGDAVLARVVPAGPACHTGARSCFGASAARGAEEVGGVLKELEARIADRASGLRPGAPPRFTNTTSPATSQHPSASSTTKEPPSYTRRLLNDRNLRLKKLGEEAAELVLACADEDRERAAEEAADLLYHTLVALRSLELGLQDVERVLDERASVKRE